MPPRKKQGNRTTIVTDGPKTSTTLTIANPTPIQPQPRQQPRRNSQRPARKNRQPRAAKRRTKQMSGTGPKCAVLSDCARDYAHALADPFNGPLSCIPDFPALNTLRQRSFARGTGATGTNGIGFVACTPNNGMAGDDNFVFSSTAAYALTTMPVTWTETGVLASDSNATMTSDQLAAGATLTRIVACGLRVRFTGAELNRGGEVYSLQEPSHFSLSGFTPAALGAYDEFRRFEMDREWKTVLYSPVDLADSAFALYANVPPTGANGNFMAHMILAPSTTAMTFAWEAFLVFEVNGRLIRGKTPSHFDPPGFAAVHAATALAPNLLPHSLPSPVVAVKHIASATKLLNDNMSGIGSNLSQTIQTIGNIGNTISGVYNASQSIGKAGGVASSMMQTASKIGAIQSGTSSAASTFMHLMEDGGEDLMKILPFAGLFV
jgi:hypothetical protein